MTVRRPKKTGVAGAELPALLPRTPDGVQFAFCGDCCSGIPGGPFEANFAAVNRVLQRLRPAPQFLLFAGDHVAGSTADYDALRAQWRHWQERETAWLRSRIPHWPSTSNHDTYDAGSEQVWREVFPALPRNGPPGQEGLSYWVRRGPLLLVSVNTSFSGLGGPGHVESEWLDRVLGQNADATYTLVFGHYPAHPVNGYTRYPLWRIVPDQAAAFWTVLVRHRVCAYLCSHIIAFDAQVHDGVLQVCSGGAGTNFGPGGFMPGPTEYLHAVQVALDGRGLRYRTLEPGGTPREWLSWPLAEPAPSAWQVLGPAAATIPDSGPEAAEVRRFRFSGRAAPGVDRRQTLLCGWHRGEQRASLEIALEPGELVVDLLPGPGQSLVRWRTAQIDAKPDFTFEVALHPALGPGGVLIRSGPAFPWSSLETNAALGTAHLPWPDEWQAGSGFSGPSDAPFRGRDLQIAVCTTRTALEE